MAKIRGTHTSPGVYTQFNDLSYAAKSLGITTLGLVGETKIGPAFDPVFVTDWNEFVDKFGGTSAEKFKDSQYPKYELPYIAKTYLTASDQLYVCRVLGLSGYNAGPAFVITASDDSNNPDKRYVVAVLRSRGVINKYASAIDPCNPSDNGYDSIIFRCDSIKLTPYTSPAMSVICDDRSISGQTEQKIYVTPYNLGQFTIECYEKDNLNPIGKYSVSLNPSSKDYIYKVLGSNPTDGDAAVFVEELYDVDLQRLSEEGKVKIINNDNDKILKYDKVEINAVTEPVSDFVSVPADNLTKKFIGQTYLCDEAGDDENMFKYTDVDERGVVDVDNLNVNCMEVGGIYVVKRYTTSGGTVGYTYVPVKVKDSSGVTSDAMVGIVENGSVDAVKVLSLDTFYCLKSDRTSVIPVEDMANYLEGFRCATTPWIVSEIKGDAKNLEVKRLFRFHTISDGTSANSMIKISISNIRPEEGLFDVFIRDFDDSDNSPIILESFRNLSMMPGTNNYIGLKIGTFDGAYETVSKYVVVEIIDNDMTRMCVPCGFLGYPTRDFTYDMTGGDDRKEQVVNPSFTYNRDFDADVKANKQYFGLSDITGVDVDMFYYKGRAAYLNNFYTRGYTSSFHLDSTLDKNIMASGSTVTVDGNEKTSGITWVTVNPQFDMSIYDHAPIIGTEAEMAGCLYEDRKTRKFTVYPYGGFDGWDIYRGSRTNTDEYKFGKYKGYIKNGYGTPFSRIDDPDVLSLDSKSITSDYYAYLAGIKQFEIPEKYAINLFATPGIDYVNNTALVGEALDMIEEKRGDSLYVVTTPDKPFGATDAMDEMYTSSDATDNLDGTNIDTYYAATYYPWVKFYDAENAMYINLPATKDAIRNMANVDNKRYPWYAPAGIERGNVECKKMHFFAKIDDEDTLYSGRINPLKTFSEDGVKIWGNKTLYTGDTPMNRINVVRLMLYMRNLISKAARKLIFDPNDVTLRDEFEGLLNPILAQIKNDRGITAYKLATSQTPEQMDQHEMSATIWVKPTPTLEYLEISFNITPQGVEFQD